MNASVNASVHKNKQASTGQKLEKNEKIKATLLYLQLL